MTLERVLMVNKYLYPRGGAEVYMLGVAELLAADGVESVFFAMQDPRNQPAPTSEFFPSCVDFGAPSGVDAARAAGRMVYSLSARRGMAALLDRHPVDVAHLHNIYHQLSPSVLAPLRQRGVPVVMTLHDYKLVCPVYTLLSHGEVCQRCLSGHLHHVVVRRCNRGSLAGSALVGLESWVHRTLRSYLRGVDLFVAPSAFLKRTLVRGGYPAERIRVVPNFVDTAAYAESPPGAGVLYAGRLSAEKGVDVLIEAAAAARVPLRVAGDGPERAGLERLAAERGADATFLGHLDGPTLRGELAAARAVAMPSVWPENCPLVALEAMAAGRPVIATAVGGLPELVRDGEDGIVVPRGDRAALADGLRRLAGDPELAARMGATGRVRAQRELSPQAHRARLLEVYGEAADRRAGRRAA